MDVEQDCAAGTVNPTDEVCWGEFHYTDLAERP